MACKPILKPQVSEYIRGLTKTDQHSVLALIGALKEHGIELKAPMVHRINHAKTHNMKELRKHANDKHFRILFAFDSNRDPVLLHAGDKQEIGWEEFYAVGIPLADELFLQHQQALAKQKTEAEKSKKQSKNPRKRRGNQ